MRICAEYGILHAYNKELRHSAPHIPFHTQNTVTVTLKTTLLMEETTCKLSPRYTWLKGNNEHNDTNASNSVNNVKKLADSV